MKFDVVSEIEAECGFGSDDLGADCDDWCMSFNSVGIIIQLLFVFIFEQIYGIISCELWLLNVSLKILT